MTEFFRVKNVHSGAIASLPASVLQNLPDWAIDDGPPPSQSKPKVKLRRTSDGPAAAPDEPAIEPTEAQSAVPAASSEKE